MHADDFVAGLIRRLQMPLPGVRAHAELVPHKDRLLATPDRDTRKAAVCILIWQKDGQFYFPLIKRNSNNPDDPHQGQIGLPGGRHESGDIALWDTAARETQEEIGIDRSKLRMLGTLSPIYIPVSQNQVFPFVAWLDGQPRFQLQEREVELLLQWEISHFAFESVIERRQPDSPAIKTPVPGFRLPPYFVWGATSMILQELKMVLREIYGSQVPA